MHIARVHSARVHALTAIPLRRDQEPSRGALLVFTICVDAPSGAAPDPSRATGEWRPRTRRCISLPSCTSALSKKARTCSAVAGEQRFELPRVSSEGLSVARLTSRRRSAAPGRPELLVKSFKSLAVEARVLGSRFRLGSRRWECLGSWRSRVGSSTCFARRRQPRRAMTSISTRTSRGKRDTWTVERAGGGVGT